MNLKELNSFKLSDAVTFHDKLNPKLWNGTKLRPEVRDQLLKIAEDFLTELGVHDLDVKDITISGSNAAYSYTKYSDLDLHILVDMGNLPVDEVYKELFNAKKTIYNDSHDITIHTIPVELYVQDSREPVVSLGEYSVLNDDWIRIPTKRRSDFDQTATKSKYEKLLGLIEIALQSKKYSKVKHIIDTIKRYRQAGLDKGGEFGPENLAYKMLRSQGYITKLYDLRDKLHSEKLSFETMYQSIDEEINPDIYDPNFKHSLKIIEFLYKAKTFIEYDEPVLYITAYKGNKQVGHVFFELHQRPGSKPWFESGGTTVESGYEGKGIASTMYAYAKMLGNDVRPSGLQTKQGKNMWTKWKKNGDAQYLMKDVTDEDYDPNGPPPGPEFKPTMPAGTVKVDVSDVYDWYKLGQHISNLKGLGKHDFGKGPPSTIMAFGDEDIEHKYIDALKKTGLTTTDIDPIDPKQPKSMPRQKVDPTYNVNESFDQPYPLKWESSDYGDVDALARLPDGSFLSIMFNQQQDNDGEAITQVEFYRNNSQEVTGEGDAQRIFATVLTAIQKYIKKYKPLRLTFSASKDNWAKQQQNSESRASLYDRLVQRYARSWGYRAFRADNGDLVIYELSRIQKQKAVGEDYTMQYASEKTPVVSPYAGVKDNQYRGGISEAADKKISFKIQKGKSKFTTTLIVDNSPAGVYQYDSNTGRSIAEVYPKFQGKGLGKLLVLHAIYTAAQLGLDFQEDESRTRAYDNVLDSLSSNGYIVDDDGYWYVTGEGEQYLKQSLNEASGYIPSEKQKNDPRFKTALTVDINPYTMKKGAKQFGWNISRAGIPPTAKTNGKIY